MCEACDKAVAETLDSLGVLVEIERETRRQKSTATVSQHTIRLANMTVDTLNDAPPEERAQAVRDMALGFACAITKLVDTP